MARRKRTSPADDLMDLVSLLPWWAGVLLAVVLYLWLHHVAEQPVTVVPARPGQMATTVLQSMWHAFASFGQYLLPLMCLAGASISVWRRRERKTLVADVAHGKAADALGGLGWRQFEMLVGEAFRLQGYQVVETGGGGADGGVDVVLTRGGEKFLVQCKQWKAFKVGVDVVRELYGVMAAQGAAGGFVVTSGRFTEDARSFAEGRNVKLVDGPKLHALILQAQNAKATPLTPPSRPAAAAPAAATAPASADGHAPACPICGKQMLKRVAKRGSNAGAAFWGCTGYPGCRGTRGM